MWKTDIAQSRIVEIAIALDTTPEWLMGWQTELSKRVNEKEAALIDGYRLLNDDGKQLVKGMVFQLNRTAPTDIEHHTVTQK